MREELEEFAYEVVASVLTAGFQVIAWAINLVAPDEDPL